MAPGWSFDTLKNALIDWVEDDGPEFSAALDRIIALAQIQVQRDLDLTTLDHMRDGNIAAGAAQVQKPDAMLATRSLFVENADGTTTYLEPRSYDFIADFNRDPAAQGAPRYYCELDNDHWQLAPVPAQAATYRARVIARAQTLSADVPTTWIATHVPDALFYAALIGCEEYLKADDRIGVWRSRYHQEILPVAAAELASQRAPAYRMPAAAHTNQ